MVDMAAISGLASSLKAVGEITKAMIGIRDGAMLQAKAIELNGIILSAQQSALDANIAQVDLTQRIRDLEAKITKLESWEAEKQRYELAEIGAGGFAHVVKSGMLNGEPIHCICSDCYQRGEKSILQMTRNTYGSVTLVCPRCKCNVEGSEDHPGYPLKREHAPDPKEKARAGLELCPICRTGRLAIISVEPDPIFGDMGVQQRKLRCDNTSCGHTESRQHDPSRT
ncbi:MAG TPA: hypothetical protein VK804_23635 [Bradyrhizobium sp.]|jgi:hypothetical protein|uniref:hypothetical protein n=1 Tax=Bradyrhizobium sp. TaxID=376 RepID=UPI002CB34A74|nr:hypothetical protein [Bradyrhizobium sp.]HTB03473.1 hypothetical protein [Bradyrhizobium sp.]